MKTDEFSAISSGRDLPISDKHAREILNFIKGMDVDKAIKALERVLIFKQAIPYKRRNDNVGHKPGMAAGRYPVKACSHIITVLKNAKNNALNKGLQESKLFIKGATIGLGISKSSRVRSRKGQYVHSLKSTHVFITLGEREEDAKQKEKKVEKPKKEVVKK